MATEDIKRVRAFLSTQPDTSKMTLQERRDRMDEMGRRLNLPRGVRAQQAGGGGVVGQWVEPEGASRNRAFLYLHGGGYVMGSVRSHRQLAGYIAKAADAPVLSIDYRLAPEHRFPAAVDDAVNGFRYLLDQGVDPQRVAVAGDSAGGGLTVATLLRLRDLGEPLPAAGICISPWVDLTCSTGSYTSKSCSDPIVNRETTLEFARMYLGDRDPREPLASPVFADLTGICPLLIQVGSEEVFLDEAVALKEAARKVGVPATLEVWDEMIHVWHAFAPMLKEARDAIEKIAQYFERRTA